MINNFAKIANKVGTSSRESNMHFPEVPFRTSTDGEDGAQDSSLGSPSDSRAVTNLREVETCFVTSTEQASARPPFEEGGLLLRPPLLEGPTFAFCFIEGCELSKDEARGAEEGEKSTTNTTKVFSMSIGLGNGKMFGRDINKGGSTEGAINIYTFLGSSALILTIGAKSDTRLD